MTNATPTAAQMLAQFNRDFGVHQAKQAAAAARKPLADDFDFEFNPAGAKAAGPAVEDTDFEFNPA